MNKAVFIDRDDTIIVDQGYYATPEGVAPFPGAIDGMKELVGLGYRPIIISNQSAIGRGMVSLEQVHLVNDRVVTLFKEHGIDIVETYYCPHAPEATCTCRKPNPEMIENAARDFDIDLASSIMIGDKKSDIKAGRAAGCGLNVLLNKGGEAGEGYQVAVDWAEAVTLVAAFEARR